MNWTSKFSLAGGLALLMAGVPAQAATYVGGAVSGTWTTNDSPYIVQSNITIAWGAQLAIDPGVVVRFQTGTGIEVKGVMTAQGTANNKILFTSDQTVRMPGDWGTISLVGLHASPNPTMSLRNCVVEYGTIGITAIADTGSQGLGASLLVEDVTSRLCAQHGILLACTGFTAETYVTSTITVEMSRCLIYSNALSGIECQAIRVDYYSAGHVSGTIKNSSVFANGQNGFVYSGNSVKPSLWNNVIWGNAAAGIAMDLYVGEIRNNIIVSNTVGITGVNLSGWPYVVFNDVWANGANWAEEAVPYASWTGNISVNPLCANPGAGDFHLRSEVGRYDPATGTWVRDTVTSPCIDAGDPESSFASEPQPNGARINMGACGGTTFASKSIPRLTGALDAGTRDFVLSWGCQPSETYQVLYSLAVTGPWLDDLPGSQLTAGPSQIWLTYTNAAISAETNRFYRVRWNAP